MNLETEGKIRQAVPNFLKHYVKYVSELNLKNMYDQRPGTSPERPIIWSPGRPATGSRRRPVDVPI